MYQKKYDEMMIELEKLVDRFGDGSGYVMEDIKTALIEICHLKAEHLRTNWQDENDAVSWDDAVNNFNQ
jgi:hypothetical protein